MGGTETGNWLDYVYDISLSTTRLQQTGISIKVYQYISIKTDISV